MINYSIFPCETVFEGFDEMELSYEEYEISSELTLVVERINENQVKISQIISSNPQNYLRTEIQPGMILNSSFCFN